MYEMVTGKVPFDADTPVSIALMHMQEKPVEPIELNPNIPNSVNKIIIKAMQKDANLRYQSASEMLKDLNMALKNPDGNFVFMKDIENDFPTQKIPTMYDTDIAKENPVRKGVNTKKKENKLVAFMKRHKIFSFIVIAILLFVATIAITYFGLKLTQVKDVALPNIVGMSKEEAEKTVKDLKLVYTELEPQFSPDVPEGYIISQEPRFIDNYMVKEKSEVKVVVSKGQEITTVPKVVGLTKEEAIKALEDANLLAEVIEDTSKTVEEGYVISQETRENTEVNAGETIKIHVSIGTGIEQVTVPYLIGKTEAEAKKLLTDNKLKVKEVIYGEDKTKDDGTVLKQDKEAGTTVDAETAVTITVNKIAKMKTGKVIVNVKSITGYRVPENENTVSTVSKTVKVRIVVGDDVIYNGTVNKTETNLSKEFQGIGTVTVKVYMDDVLEKTVQLNLNEKTSVTVE